MEAIINYDVIFALAKNLVRFFMKKGGNLHTSNFF